MKDLEGKNRSRWNVETEADRDDEVRYLDDMVDSYWFPPARIVINNRLHTMHDSQRTGWFG